MEDLIAAPRPLRLGLLAHNTIHRPLARPLRIVSAPSDAFARIKLSDDPDDQQTSATSSEHSPSIESSLLDGSLSPSSSLESTPPSTRLALPQEALDEFLAISLKRINRRNVAGSTSSLPSPYERPHPYRIKKSLSSASSTEEDDRRSKRGVGRRPHRNSESELRSASPLTILDHESDWSNFALGSPISRNHTRNPLPRHPSYETLSSKLIFPFNHYTPPQASATLMVTSSMTNSSENIQDSSMDVS